MGPSSPASERGFPDLRRRTRIVSAKCAIEIREIAEPDVIRHRADGAIRKAWVAQHAVCAQEPLTEDECREGQAFVLEEFVKIPWCDAMACGDGGDRQIAVAKMCADVRHERLEARRGDAPTLRNRFAVACGADGCGE